MDLEETYELHVDKVYRFFYIKSLDRDIAEDLTSQTFMALVETVRSDADHVRQIPGSRYAAGGQGLGRQGSWRRYH